MENPKHSDELTEIRLDTHKQVLKRPPWSPALIATITILFSVLPGGIFHALNYERLGLPQRKRSNLIINILLFLFIFLVSFRAKPVLFGLIQLIFHIGCATHFYKSQNTLFQKHLAENNTRASIIYPIFLSILIYIILLGFTFGLSYLFEI
jgi:hypothetical protein